MRNIKLKYYLRGLGIGVLVTVLILGIANRGDGTMTDAEIREKALELGMVDANSIVLSELQNGGADESESIAQESEAEEPQEELQEESQEELQEEPQEELQEESEVEPELGKETEEEMTVQTENLEETLETEAPPDEEKGSDVPDISDVQETPDTEGDESDLMAESEAKTAESVIIRIRSGASSYSVSKDLEAAGLVEDAIAYDAYLCDRGYSRIIRIGTYEIAVGADEEEIAQIITGKR